MHRSLYHYFHGCGRRTLVLRAYTRDLWQFDISGDIGYLREHKTSPQGIHNNIASMDIVRHDFVLVYELIAKTSCTYRAVTGDECKTNPTYMSDHCDTTCKLITLVSLLQSTLINFYVIFC